MHHAILTIKSLSNGKFGSIFKPVLFALLLWAAGRTERRVPARIPARRRHHLSAQGRSAHRLGQRRHADRGTVLRRGLGGLRRRGLSLRIHHSVRRHERIPAGRGRRFHGLRVRRRHQGRRRLGSGCRIGEASVGTGTHHPLTHAALHLTVRA